MNKLINWISRSGWFLFLILMVYLTVHSFFYTAVIDLTKNSESEYIEVMTDNILTHILFFTVLCSVCIWKKRKNSRSRCKFFVGGERWFGILCAVLLVLLVVPQNIKPTADQLLVLSNASMMRAGDFSFYYTGGYMEMYPNQNGFSLLLYALQPFLGDGNYHALQVLNVFALAIAWYYCGKIYAVLFKDCEKISTACLYLYFPLSLYVVFVYGVVLGMMFAVMSFYYAIVFSKELKYRYALISAISMAAAVQMKNNYLIFMLALIIILLITALAKKEWQILVCAAAIAVFLFMSNLIVQSTVEHITGVQLSKGIPKNTWIMMGLSENNQRADGWYNGFGQMIYGMAGYDYTLAKETTDILLKERISRMAGDIAGTRLFFHNKLTTTWTEPTFQSFWIYQIPHLLDGPSSKFGEWFFDGPVYALAIMITNLFQTVVYFGAAVYAWTKRKEDNIWLLLLPVCFIGGFLFHLFWETKSQYTIIYYVLLLPMAVSGIQVFVQTLENTVQKLKDREKSSAS